MRLFIAAMVVCLAINPTIKPDQHAKENKAATDKERESSVVIFNNEKTGANTQGESQERPKWYGTVNWSNWALVLVALFTGFAIWKQATDTAKAAQASKEAAEAARLNAQALINAERARVTIELGPTCFRENKQWHREDGSVFTPGEILAGKHLVHRLRIMNLGKTPAHIFNYKVNFGPLVQGTKFSAEKLESERLVKVNAFLAAGESRNLEDVSVQDAFSHDTKTGAYCVTVRYGDVLTGKDEHETFVHYSYRGSDYSLDRITTEDRYT
jgi:hypothetical protein